MGKVLYLIRGVPGSGKSSLGETLCPGLCFSADQYFERDGQYMWVGSQIPNAHHDCQQRTLEAMKQGHGQIAVANTFMAVKDMAVYKLYAAKHGYTVFVLTCENDFGNVHGVPEDAVARMAAKWQPNLPVMEK